MEGGERLCEECSGCGEEGTKHHVRWIWRVGVLPLKAAREPKEYIVVNQWFHLVEGEHPHGEDISYTYQKDMYNMWTEVVASLDEALEVADDAKGKKEATPLVTP